MVEAQLVPFRGDEGQVLAVHGLHYGVETFGQAHGERELADVVQQPRQERQFGQLRQPLLDEQAAGEGATYGMLPQEPFLQSGQGGTRVVEIARRTCDRQAADGVETEYVGGETYEDSRMQLSFMYKF